MALTGRPGPSFCFCGVWHAGLAGRMGKWGLSWLGGPPHVHALPCSHTAQPGSPASLHVLPLEVTCLFPLVTSCHCGTSLVSRPHSPSRIPPRRPLSAVCCLLSVVAVSGEHQPSYPRPLRPSSLWTLSIHSPKPTLFPPSAAHPTCPASGARHYMPVSILVSLVASHPQPIPSRPRRIP